ncbi:unnamed protein product [Plasmodium vivax]|uniref:(malaria parasite P. vivax) hypothetical protein n=1 Tax=Plasmodium vivax TaxID=5855 RepID=A0A8S4HIA4_PLAVI|nr:unnamed protein product [Plasmodium vivax]
MSENELDKSLLNYEKYFVLKGKFEKTENKKDELNLDEFLDNEKYYNSKKDAFRDVLKELLKHLRNSGVLLSHRDEACSYISYILSKEVKAKGYTYDKEIFEMFQRFVEKYNNRTGYKSSYCSNTLVHVNFENYNKMEKLYALYEEFNKFLKDYALWKEDVLHCSALHSFLNQYKDFIRNYQPTKIKYKNILDHFRNEIKKQVGYYNTFRCNKEHFHIELHTLTEDNKPEASRQVEQRPNHAGYQEFQAKILPPPVVSETRPAESERPHVVSQAAHVHFPTHHGESHSSKETLAQSSHLGVGRDVQGLTHGVIPKSKLEIDLSPEYPPHNGPFEFPGTSLYSERYQHSPEPPSSKEVEATSSVMSTITSALKDVEPGPVLGVSGGMGVLFLLFKVFIALRIYLYVYNTFNKELSSSYNYF